MGQSRCSDCVVKNRLKHKTWAMGIYDQILDHYSRACVCCGETNPQFLTLDHINNDGSKQRREMGNVGRGGYTYYKHVIDSGFPTDLQILCFNCNLGKNRNHGVCPHKAGAVTNA